MICLVTFCQMGIVTESSASSSGIFFEYSSSQKLVTDIKYFTVNYPKIEQKYNICTQQLDLSTREIATTNQLLGGCNSDKKILSEVSEEFKTKYVNTYDKLTKTLESRPSRFTWFSIGGITTAVSIVALLLLSK